LANVGKSGKSITAFWQIFKLGYFMYKKMVFLGIKRSSIPLPNLLNTCQICRTSHKNLAGRSFSPKTANFWRVLEFAKFAGEWPLLTLNACLHTADVSLSSLKNF
jgi:hypothetical protein